MEVEMKNTYVYFFPEHSTHWFVIVTQNSRVERKPSGIYSQFQTLLKAEPSQQFYNPQIWPGPKGGSLVVDENMRRGMWTRSGLREKGEKSQKGPEDRLPEGTCWVELWHLVANSAGKSATDVKAKPATQVKTTQLQESTWTSIELTPLSPPGLGWGTSIFITLCTLGSCDATSSWGPSEMAWEWFMPQQSQIHQVLFPKKIEVTQSSSGEPWWINCWRVRCEHRP